MRPTRDIAVIVDSFCAYTSRLFPYFCVYNELGWSIDKNPFMGLQYLETHNHPRFICNFGTIASDNELLKEGNRVLWYKVQPYLIGLFTAKGILMLWQGQEFGENAWLPQEGWGRVLLYRPVCWEYFYTSEGRSLVHLVRKLVKIRRDNQQFTRGEHYFYNDFTLYQSRSMLFSRTYEEVFSLVALNFGVQDQAVPFKFPRSGNYLEELYGLDNLTGGFRQGSPA